MKEITFRVPDDMAQLLEEWAKRIPEMEIVRREECLDAAIDDMNLRMALAIKALNKHGAIRYYYDYTWIMVAIGDGVVKGMNAFRSPQSFIDYLKSIGVAQIPCRATISNNYNKVYGTYPDWEFTDTEDPSEILRRKNVVKQFLSAINKI